MKAQIFYIGKPVATITVNNNIVSIDAEKDHRDDVHLIWDDAVRYYKEKTKEEVLAYLCKRQRGYWEFREITEKE